jgi:dCTP diphosphatase
VRLSDRLGVDLLQAAERKMAINAKNYPAEHTRGAIRKTPRKTLP